MKTDHLPQHYSPNAQLPQTQGDDLASCQATRRQASCQAKSSGTAFTVSPAYSSCEPLKIHPDSHLWQSESPGLGVLSAEATCILVQVPGRTLE